jgi:hypothetical protein
MQKFRFPPDLVPAPQHCFPLRPTKHKERVNSLACNTEAGTSLPLVVENYHFILTISFEKYFACQIS